MNSFILSISKVIRKKKIFELLEIKKNKDELAIL